MKRSRAHRSLEDFTMLRNKLDCTRRRPDAFCRCFLDRGRAGRIAAAGLRTKCAAIRATFAPTDATFAAIAAISAATDATFAPTTAIAAATGASSTGIARPDTTARCVTTATSFVATDGPSAAITAICAATVAIGAPTAKICTATSASAATTAGDPIGHEGRFRTSRSPAAPSPGFVAYRNMHRL